MDSKQRTAEVLLLISELHTNGSWCGETHIQKSVGCLQLVTGLDFGFKFVLYKHGPFSFDLRDELTAYQVYNLIRIQPNQPPYGPSLLLTERGDQTCNDLKHRGVESSEIASDIRKIEFIARYLGKRGVADLERLVTAVYVTKNEGLISTEERVQRICELKPHISAELAGEAVHEADRLFEISLDIST